MSNHLFISNIAGKAAPVTPPPLKREYESLWNNSTSPKMVSVTTSPGDLVVVYGLNESNAVLIATPTGNSLTYTSRANSSGANQGSGTIWTAVDAAGGTNWTLQVTRAADGTLFWGFGVLVFDGTLIGGIGAAEQASNGGTPTLSITTTAINSSIVFAMVDWNANANPIRTWKNVNSFAPTAANMGERVFHNASGNYTTYSGYYSDVGSIGAKLVGLETGTYGGLTVLALEVKDAPAGFPQTGLSIVGSDSTGTPKRVSVVSGVASSGSDSTGTPKRVAISVSTASQGSDSTGSPKRVSTSVGITSQGSDSTGVAKRIYPVSGRVSVGSDSTGVAVGRYPVTGISLIGSDSYGVAKKVRSATGTSSVGSDSYGATRKVGKPNGISSSASAAYSSPKRIARSVPVSSSASDSFGAPKRLGRAVGTTSIASDGYGGVARQTPARLYSASLAYSATRKSVASPGTSSVTSDSTGTPKKIGRSSGVSSSASNPLSELSRLSSGTCSVGSVASSTPKRIAAGRGTESCATDTYASPRSTRKSSAVSSVASDSLGVARRVYAVTGVSSIAVGSHATPKRVSRISTQVCTAAKSFGTPTKKTSLVANVSVGSSPTSALSRLVFARTYIASHSVSSIKTIRTSRGTDSAATSISSNSRKIVASTGRLSVGGSSYGGVARRVSGSVSSAVAIHSTPRKKIQSVSQVSVGSCPKSSPVRVVVTATKLSAGSSTYGTPFRTQRQTTTVLTSVNPISSFSAIARLHGRTVIWTVQRGSGRKSVTNSALVSTTIYAYGPNGFPDQGNAVPFTPMRVSIVTAARVPIVAVNPSSGNLVSIIER